MIGAHQPVFDRDLTRDEVDEPSMHEMGADTPRAVFVQVDALLFDPRQSADARADRRAGAQPRRLVHVGEPRVLDRLPRRIQAVNDECIDLPLRLVVDTLGRIEAIFVVRRLHLARDAAFLVAGVEFGDPSGAAFRRQDILPAGLDVASERSHQPETRHHDTAHRHSPKNKGSNRRG